MAFKDILIFLDPTPASDERLKMAIRLAKDARRAADRGGRHRRCGLPRPMARTRAAGRGRFRGDDAIGRGRGATRRRRLPRGRSQSGPQPLRRSRDRAEARGRGARAYPVVRARRGFDEIGRADADRARKSGCSVPSATAWSSPGTPAARRRALSMTRCRSCKKARKVVVFAFSQKQSALRASADRTRRTPRAPRRLGDRFRLDQHRRDLGHRGVVRQSRHPGLRPDCRRRLRPFAHFRGPFRRREPRSAPAAVAAGADVA